MGRVVFALFLVYVRAAAQDHDDDGPPSTDDDEAPPPPPNGKTHLWWYRKALQEAPHGDLKDRSMFDQLLSTTEAEHVPEFTAKDEDPCFDGDNCGQYGDVGEDPGKSPHPTPRVQLTTIREEGKGPNDGVFLKKHVRKSTSPTRHPQL